MSVGTVVVSHHLLICGAVQDALRSVFEWLIPESEDANVWPTVIRFKEVDQVAITAQYAALVGQLVAEASQKHAVTSETAGVMG